MATGHTKPDADLVERVADWNAELRRQIRDGEADWSGEEIAARLIAMVAEQAAGIVEEQLGMQGLASHSYSSAWDDAILACAAAIRREMRASAPRERAI